MLSEIDKNSSDDLENEGIWALYIRTFGHEKVMVRFPRSPKLSVLPDDKASFCIQSSDEDAKYRMFVHPAKNASPQKILEEEMKNRSSLQTTDVQMQRRGAIDIIDLSFVEKMKNGSELHCTERIIVTKENIFTLISEHARSFNEADTYFLRSFDILHL